MFWTTSIWWPVLSLNEYMWLVPVLSFNTAHIYKHTKWRMVIQNPFCLFFFLHLVAFCRLTVWLVSFEITFLWSLYSLLCVGEWGRDGDKEKKSTFSFLCCSLFPLCHRYALIPLPPSTVFFHVFSLSKPPQKTQRTNNFTVPQTVCAHKPAIQLDWTLRERHKPVQPSVSPVMDHW